VFGAGRFPMSSHELAVRAQGISVDQADRAVLVDVDLSITEHSRIAVVGPNGVGKTTLFRVLLGELEPAAGTVTKTPEATTVGLLRQELGRERTLTVRDHLSLQTGVAAAAVAFERATEALSAGSCGSADAYDRCLDVWLNLGGADFDARMEATADDLGLPKRVLHLPLSALSGGQAARVGLAAMVLSRFDITLLDEPTNDLDMAGLEQLEEWVQAQEGGLAVVSHDREFLERSVTSVLVIDEHTHEAAQFNGGWASFVEERTRARDAAVERHKDYVVQRDRLAQRSQQQREWADQGVSRARKRPADGDKFRKNWKLAKADKLVGRAKATLRSMERLERVEKPWEGWNMQLDIGEVDRSANVVAALDGAVVHRGDFVLGPVDVEIRWADRVGLVGPNGCGKSTLINTLLGRYALVSGQRMLGSGVVVGELDQLRSGLPSEHGHSVLAAFQESTGLAIADARSLLAKFGIAAEAVGRSVSSLSPGERTRLHLALFQARGVNFLVLDEPTNHLDLEAIEQIESALANYQGTLLLVTHDRRLLDQVELTHTINLGQL